MPLTTHGEEQAAKLGSRLSGWFDTAFQSNLGRSRRTLSLALDHSDCKIGETHTDSRVAERSMGELEGMPSRPLPAYDEGDLFWAPSGGEPYIEVIRRIMSFLLDLTDMATAAAQRVLVSTHVGPMRMLVGVLEGIATPAEAMTASPETDSAEVRNFLDPRKSSLEDPRNVGTPLEHWPVSLDVRRPQRHMRAVTLDRTEMNLS